MDASDGLSPNYGKELTTDCGLDNWCSDNEEVLQEGKIHPEIFAMEKTSDSWEHQNDDDLYNSISNDHYHSISDAHHTHRNLDTTYTGSYDFVKIQQMTIAEEETALLYTVVLPYTGISRQIKGAGVGLSMCGGFSLNQGLVAIITDVDLAGPGFMIGNLTAGCIVHKWNGVSLLNTSYEQTKEILTQRVLYSELSLLVSNDSSVEIEEIKLLSQSQVVKANETLSNSGHNRSRRQSVISCSSEIQWIFEERNFSEEKSCQSSVAEIKPKIEKSCGNVQISMLHVGSKLEVTLHQAELCTDVALSPVACVTLIGEELSNSDGLLMSQTSQSASHTINPVWNQKFEPFRLPKKLLSCTGLHLIIWDCRSDDQYSFIGEVFLNLSAASRRTDTAWYLLASHDPNLPQLATPVGVKKRATINRLFDRVLSTNKRVARSLNLKQDLASSEEIVPRRNSSPLFNKLRGKTITGRKADKSSRMIAMHPKVSVVKEATSTEGDESNSYHTLNKLSQQVYKNKGNTSPASYSPNGRTVEVEAVVEPHAYQPAWGLETEQVHKKPNPDQHGFEVRQEQLGSPSSGYTSVHQSETSSESINRNSGFSNYSNSSTESPDVIWHQVQDMGIKYSTMVRRSLSMSSFPVMGNSNECQAMQGHSQQSTNSGQPFDDFPRLKPAHRSRSVEVLVDTDSSTELSRTDNSFSSQEDTDRGPQRPENLIMSFKMKYSAVQQPSAPHKSRIFFIKTKKIKAPFRLFRSKHSSDSSQASKTSSSPEGSKVLTQQRKELGIGQFIPKLDHLQEPCGRIRFSLVQHRRILLKIRTVEERSPTISANECGIKATLVQGKEVICKKKMSTTLNSAANPLAEMYLDSHGYTDRTHLHIVITKGTRLSKKYVGEVWVNMKWADLSGLSSWYQLYT